ncbi:MAG: hypothetical protein HY687_03775 [Chloroflexi bacterium]|nr:hypothetical protein [Chloroflexota bacterium]
MMSLITARPETLVMTLDQLPLTGYQEAADFKVDQSGRGRYFYGGGTSNVLGSILIFAYPLTPGEAVNSWIKSHDCRHAEYGDGTLVSSTELSGRIVGEGTRVCRHDFQGAYVSQIIFLTGTRNLGVLIKAAPSTRQINNDEVYELLTQLAERQLDIIDQKSPPGPVMAVATGVPPFQFTAPATLPQAEAGKQYLPNGQPFSFCDPPTTGFTTQCPPPGTTERNPSGGSPPYHFKLGPLGGFPPFGMALGKDGQLTGKPPPSSPGKTYTFIVCAVDLKGDFVCRQVSITIVGGATLALGATQAAAGATVTVSGQGFTPGATVTVRIGGTTVATFTADASGAFTGSMVVPAQLAPNTYTVMTTDTSGQTASAPLTVTAPPPPTASLTITAARCTFIQSSPYGSPYKRYEIVISGTASGPVGALLQMAGMPSHTVDSQAGTSSWGSRNSTSEYRRTGDPETTPWTVRIVLDRQSGYTQSLDAKVLRGSSNLVTEPTASTTVTCP